jgi:hypothetical protein
MKKTRSANMKADRNIDVLIANLSCLRLAKVSPLE